MTTGLLHLSAARLFVLIVGLWSVGTLVSALVATLAVAGWPIPGPLVPALLVLAALARAAARIIVVLWLARIATGLVRERRRGRLDDATNLSIASGYLAAHSLAVCVLPVLARFDLPGAGAAGYVAANAMQFGVFALASYVLLAYKAAVRLEVAEGYDATSVASRWRDWLGFLVFAVGLWWLQPRVRAAVGRGQEVAIEDHLVS